MGFFSDHSKCLVHRHQESHLKFPAIFYVNGQNLLDGLCQRFLVKLEKALLSGFLVLLQHRNQIQMPLNCLLSRIFRIVFKSDSNCSMATVMKFFRFFGIDLEVARKKMFAYFRMNNDQPLNPFQKT